MHKYSHVTSIINVWTKYGEPRLHGNGKTVKDRGNLLKALDTINSKKKNTSKLDEK
jgi:hypothetical protein